MEIILVKLPKETKPTLETFKAFARKNIENSGVTKCSGVTGYDLEAFEDDSHKNVKIIVKGDYKFSDIRNSLNKYRQLMVIAFGSDLEGGKQ